MWTETQNEYGITFAVWLTFFVFGITLILTGSVGLLIWAWPPSFLVIAAFLLGMWGGSKGWWDKINQ